MSVVLVISTGDMGEQPVAGLAVSGRVRPLVLAGRSSAAFAVVAAPVAGVSGCLIELVRAGGGWWRTLGSGRQLPHGR